MCFETCFSLFVGKEADWKLPLLMKRNKLSGSSYEHLPRSWGATDIYCFIRTCWFLSLPVLRLVEQISQLFSLFFSPTNILLSSKEAHGLTGGECSMSSDYPEVPISYFLRCREFTVAGDQTAGCARGEVGSGEKLNEG